MGYYVPGVNMPGLSLPLLIDGVDYPGVQVYAPAFGQDTVILDAKYSSAYADLYLGLRPIDINVAGGGYTDTFSSYAPEELVPGSEFDTLDLRVYTRPVTIYTGNGTTASFVAPEGSVAVEVTVSNAVLTPVTDYTYDAGVVTLSSAPPMGAQVVVLESDPVSAGLTFRIFQDMRGVQATYRITPNTTTAGTSVASHAVGAVVYNMSQDNLLPLPYQNYVDSYSQLGNGTNTVFRANGVSLVYSENFDTLPFDFGDVTGDPGSYDFAEIIESSAAVEVYVGGIRILSGYTVTQIAPVVVVFDTAPANGVEVTILIRRGVTWYAPGVEMPSNGEPLQITETVPARFLRG
jgi:hypothetical protein